MELRLRLALVIAVILFIIIMVNFIKKDNISIKYSLVWLGSAIFTIILILIPNFLELLSKILGFQLISNMIYLVAIVILFLISFLFTVIASRQTKKIRLLVQEISLLKNRVEVLEKNAKK